MLIFTLIQYILSFVAIWFGAGLIVSSVDKFSRKLRFSSFAISFVILGVLTSTPEFGVGLTAIREHNPSVFIGNLLGGIPAIFLFVIPILAILGNGIAIKQELKSDTLISILAVILAPSIIILDKRVSTWEGIYLILLYLFLLYVIERKHGLFDKADNKILDFKAYSYRDIIKILAGMAIVFVMSNLIVDETMFLSQLFSVPPFYLSLIALSLGTNLPELSLAIRSVINGKKDVAFGDYLGSAAANTFLFGIFTLMNNGEVVTSNNFLVTFIFIAFGLILFYVFSRSENKVSRKEGIVLLTLYIIFVIVEHTL